jgi:hypothetical protein
MVQPGSSSNVEQACLKAGKTVGDADAAVATEAAKPWQEKECSLLRDP